MKRTRKGWPSNVSGSRRAFFDAAKITRALDRVTPPKRCETGEVSIDPGGAYCAHCLGDIAENCRDPMKKANQQ